ncbi:MAG: hypothetical protein HY696_01875 [Deltaproteobacteria bacterium]|nr:hypothetical protein [Deltaproteobacteria bacterium]
MPQRHRILWLGTMLLAVWCIGMPRAGSARTGSAEPTIPPMPAPKPMACTYSDVIAGEGLVVSLQPCRAVQDFHTGCIYRLTGFLVTQGLPKRACFDVTSGDGQTTIPSALCLSPLDQNMGPAKALGCMTTLEVLKLSPQTGHALVTIPRRDTVLTAIPDSPGLPPGDDSGVPPTPDQPGTPGDSGQGGGTPSTPPPDNGEGTPSTPPPPVPAQ